MKLDTLKRRFKTWRLLAIWDELEMILPKNFNPEMLDEKRNVFRLSFPAIFTHDSEVDCVKNNCQNPAHFRLLNIETGLEVTNSFSRIDAMHEVWHNA